MKNDRSHYLGGSDIPNVLRQGYLSPYELFLLKRGEIEIPDSYETMMGKKLEPIIIDLFLNSLQISKTDNDWLFHTNQPDEYGVGFTHPTHSFLKSHLDGYNEKDKTVLECKATSVPINKEKIPTHWLLQVAFYCELSDAEKAYIAVFTTSTKPLHIYTYERNEALQTHIIDKSVEFWEKYIIKNIAPPVSSISDISTKNKILFHLKENDELKELTFNTEQEALLNEYKEAKENYEFYKKQKEKLKIKLYEDIKDYHIINDENGNALMTYKFNKRGSIKIDRKYLQEKYPDIYNKVAITTAPMRVMRIK